MLAMAAPSTTVRAENIVIRCLLWWFFEIEKGNPGCWNPAPDPTRHHRQPLSRRIAIPADLVRLWTGWRPRLADLHRGAVDEAGLAIAAYLMDPATLGLGARGDAIATGGTASGSDGVTQLAPGRRVTM
jgi:hypothetical protein